MTSVDTRWMSVEIPEGFRGSVERAEIIVESADTRGRVRVAALRNDAPYLMTIEDAKQYAEGGDRENPRTCYKETLCERTGYFASAADDRYLFSVVIGNTLMLLSSDGFELTDAQSTINAILAGLTINQEG